MQWPFFITVGSISVQHKDILYRLMSSNILFDLMNCACVCQMIFSRSYLGYFVYVLFLVKKYVAALPAKPERTGSAAEKISLSGVNKLSGPQIPMIIVAI